MRVGERSSLRGGLHLACEPMRADVSQATEASRPDAGQRKAAGRRAALPAVAALAITVLIPVFRLQELTWLEATAASVTFVIPCVLLGWSVWRLLTRRPRARNWLSAAALHAASAVAFSILWTLPLVALVYALRKDVSPAYLSGGAVWQLAWGVAIYCALLIAVRTHQRLRERELAAANAELQALRAQLHPHFLFNTLHSLTQLAREDPIATQNALLRFGELMRYVLSCGRGAGADVALEDELEFVRNYLALEKLRMADRLRIDERIDPEALELAVPPLLLQPLVENAVRHGLSRRRRGGALRLTASAQDDRLFIEVSDDGAGAEPPRVRESTGLGLRAVARQLQAHFGADAEFSIETQPAAGFSVKLTMPARLPAVPLRSASAA